MYWKSLHLKPPNCDFYKPKNTFKKLIYFSDYTFWINADFSDIVFSSALWNIIDLQHV